ASAGGRVARGARPARHPGTPFRHAGLAALRPAGRRGAMAPSCRGPARSQGHLLMNTAPLRLAALAALLAAALPASAELRITDDTGRELVLPGPAERIVSLAPHVTELLFAAGAGEKVVGV